MGKFSLDAVYKYMKRASYKQQNDHEATRTFYRVFGSRGHGLVLMKVKDESSKNVVEKEDQQFSIHNTNLDSWDLR
jgi:hypothetical protein